jgi:hypothetical protein
MTSGYPSEMRGEKSLIQPIFAKTTGNANLNLQTEAELTKISDVIGIYKRHGTKRAVIQSIV